MDTPKYITEVEVNKIIQRALPTLRNDRHLGRGIPYIRLGRSIRYDLADVISYMDQRKINTTSI